MKPHLNPFRMSRLESLRFRDPAAPDDADIVRTIRNRLRATHGRGSIIGPHGSGKTTLLDELAPLLAHDGLDGRPLEVRRITLHEDRRGLTSDEQHAVRLADDATAIIVDGADLLSRLAWLRLRFSARRAAVLLATSHGRCLLPPIHRTITTPALLHGLVCELTCETGADVPPMDELESSWRRFDGNLRDALRDLYDRVGSRSVDPIAQTSRR